MAGYIKKEYVYFHLFIYLLMSQQSMNCGPGRGSGRRRGPRKMTPLVFKQHVPNVSENTLGASGLAEARITRDSPKFSELKVNYSPDISFKDEEGTGADRVMTQRCKDKLNTLAISAMNQWPGVKLRVTEAWDEDVGQHAKDSLHYEGRAVDITTSDRDRSKYGMLARLAVEAGFDWVYYESRGHIHCSVKSDSSIAVKNGGCFPGESTVQLEDGRQLPLSKLSIGDKVLVLNTEGQLIYDDVILFLHRDEHSVADFIVLETDMGKSFTATANHLVYVTTNRENHINRARPEFARDVTPNQYLYIRSADDTVVTTKVTAVRPHQAFGAYAPLTKHGTVVVDDVIASCYAVIRQQDIAHAALAPVRWYYSIKQYISSVFTQLPENARNLSHVTESQAPPVSGIHWYVEVLHNIGLWVVPASLWFES